MRVAVIGYFGHLNAGDELLQSALTWALRDHLLLFTSWYSPELLNHADLVIVGGGGQWPASPFFREGEWFARRLESPLIVVGISATHDDPGVRQSTLPLIDKSSYFQVRDRETRRILGDHPKIVTGVDLFWWMPWDAPYAATATTPSTAALALRDWKPTPWDPAGVVESVRRSLAILPFPFHYGSMAGNPKSEIDDRTFLERLGLADVPAVWSPAPARTADVTVAMRYHAIQVAVRFGRPAIGLDVDPKIGRFFDEHGVAELCVAPDDLEALDEALSRVTADYPEYCRRFARIRDRLQAQGASDLAAFREAVAAVRPDPRSRSGRLRRGLAALLGRLRS